ncbi:hypothetical protein ACP4OV_029261 [Aristida adscensionis]
MAGAPPPPAGQPVAPPFLLFDAGEKYLNRHVQYSVASRLEVDTTIGELRGEYHSCFETPQGWVLVLHRSSRQPFLWRPQDRRHIYLPRMAMNLPRNCKCLLTHKLSSDNSGAADPCVVVLLDLDCAQYWFCRVRGATGAQHRRTGWQHRSYTIPTLDAEGRRRKGNIARSVGIAAVEGKIYFELSEREMGVLEFDPVHARPTLTRIKVNMVRIPHGFPTWLRYFVESCGELFLVILYFRPNCRRKVFRVSLYKMDFSAPTWCKVDHIGDRVFLLCGDQSSLSRFGASCSASDHALTANQP